MNINEVNEENLPVPRHLFHQRNNKEVMAHESIGG